MRLKKCPLCKRRVQMVESKIQCPCGYGIAWTGENAQIKAARDWNRSPLRRKKWLTKNS